MVNISQEIKRCLIYKIAAASRQRRAASVYISRLTHGWINCNEVRHFENLPPIPCGEIFTVQAASVS